MASFVDYRLEIKNCRLSLESTLLLKSILVVNGGAQDSNLCGYQRLCSITTVTQTSF